MLNRGVQQAQKIRETCRRIGPQNPTLKRDIMELIEEIDRFLECVTDVSRDAT